MEIREIINSREIEDTLIFLKSYKDIFSKILVEQKEDRFAIEVEYLKSYYRYKYFRSLSFCIEGSHLKYIEKENVTIFDFNFTDTEDEKSTSLENSKIVNEILGTLILKVRQILAKSGLKGEDISNTLINNRKPSQYADPVN